MISWPYQAIDGDVQRLCGVAGKGHLIRPGAVEQRRQLFPGGVNGPGSGEAPIMGPPAQFPLESMAAATASMTRRGL